MLPPGKRVRLIQLLLLVCLFSHEGSRRMEEQFPKNPSRNSVVAEVCPHHKGLAYTANSPVEYRECDSNSKSPGNSPVGYWECDSSSRSRGNSPVGYRECDSSSRSPDGLMRIPGDASAALSWLCHRASGKMDYSGSPFQAGIALGIRMSQWRSRFIIRLTPETPTLNSLSLFL